MEEIFKTTYIFNILNIKFSLKFWSKIKRVILFTRTEPLLLSKNYRTVFFIKQTTQKYTLIFDVPRRRLLEISPTNFRNFGAHFSDVRVGENSIFCSVKNIVLPSVSSFGSCGRVFAAFKQIFLIHKDSYKLGFLLQIHTLCYRERKID